MPACVDSFYLDTYEVTVARFAEFVADYDAWRTAGDPTPGAGQYDSQAATGWDQLLASARNYGDPAYRDYWVGFRCAATEYREAVARVS